MSRASTSASRLKAFSIISSTVSGVTAGLTVTELVTPMPPIQVARHGQRRDHARHADHLTHDRKSKDQQATSRRNRQQAPAHPAATPVRALTTAPSTRPANRSGDVGGLPTWRTWPP